MPNRKKGFTLIELLIAITIIGILSTIITYGLIGQQRKARDAKRKSDVTQLKRALQAAKNDCRNAAFYPVFTGGATDIINLTSLQTHLVNSKYLSASVTDPKPFTASHNYQITYLNSAPNLIVANVCPNSSGTFNVSGTTNYKIYSQLEATSDPDAPASTAQCPTSSDTTSTNYMPFANSTINQTVALNTQAYVACGF